MEPTIHFAPYSTLRGLVQDFTNISSDVLLLEGEHHLHRKPGFLRFMSTESRERFAKTVLHDLRAPEKVRGLAARIVQRMAEAVEGRQWMGAHMRRGDCKIFLCLMQ